MIKKNQFYKSFTSFMIQLGIGGMRNVLLHNSCINNSARDETYSYP